MNQIELDSGVSSPGKPTFPSAPSIPKTEPAFRSCELGPLRLGVGTELTNTCLAYEITGPEDAPVIVALGGISAGCHVTTTRSDPSPGWWRDVVGPNCALDTSRYRILSFDYLGGNGASSGPRNRAFQGHGSSWPSVTTNDQGNALLRLLDHLGIGRIAAFVGASYGGMVGLSFAADHPSRLERLIVVSAAHRSNAAATALRTLQRNIVLLGNRQGTTHESMVLARSLAMTTYRTAQEFDTRFDGPPRLDGAHFRFPIEDYLHARGEAFAQTFNPEAFLRLSESIDLHKVDPRRIATPTLLVAVPSDPLVPIGLIRRLADLVSGPCQLVELDSNFGHDAFLKETNTLSGIIRNALEARTRTRSHHR